MSKKRILAFVSMVAIVTGVDMAIEGYAPEFYSSAGHIYCYVFYFLFGVTVESLTQDW